VRTAKASQMTGFFVFPGIALFYTYIINTQKTCRFYIGFTADLAKRIERHNLGTTRSTKRGRPWVLFYFEEYTSKTTAPKRERELKSWKSHQAIEALVSSVQEVVPTRREASSGPQ
ncbi:MAG: GIY-YIG nuclease family protein, partial [Bacteroidetes bacterium]|nr:GIY-YIG nuclease family protein [Bacteroidota bacterium]